MNWASPPAQQGEHLLNQLLALSDLTAQKRLLDQHRTLLQNTDLTTHLAESLKGRADHFLRSQINRSHDFVDLIWHLVYLTGNSLYEALALRAEGNIHGIGEGNFQQAIDCYDAAAAIYHAQNLPLDEARTQVGKIGCLSYLSRYGEALAVGTWAASVLRAHAEWPLLTGLLSNLSIIYYRLGQGEDAVALIQEAREVCIQTGNDQELAGIEVNHAFILRSLGQLDASIAADQRAYDLFMVQERPISAARAQASMAISHLVYGRFNRALSMFDQVLAIYLGDQRHYDALLVQHYVTDCLLQLGRFEDVLARCSQIRPLFSQLGVKLDIGKTLLNEGVAYAGLHQFEQAGVSLQEARHHFEAEGNYVWAAMSDVEQAAIYYRQGAFQACFDLAGACQAIFHANKLQLQAAQAQLLAAMGAVALDQAAQAERFITAAERASRGEDIPWLRYQIHHLRGKLARQGGDHAQAIIEYERAIDQLERLRGQVMIEFRVDFLADKAQVYEEMVSLHLALEQPEQALQYVERAKSRALIELLAYQLDLQLRPRSTADQDLIATLQHLRDKRNQLIRGWTTTMDQDKQDQAEIQQTVLEIEREITDLWHRLLIRNADYARDAALTHVRSEPIQPYLNEETVLLEYFTVADGLVLFLVTKTGVQAHRLPGKPAQITAPARLLNLSFKAVPNSSPEGLARLRANTQLQLQKLYDALIAPVASAIAGFKRLIIVPHGPLLHYLPFHALYTDEQYLIEQFEISYLPSASLLHYAAPSIPSTAAQTQAAFGYSYGDHLPYALREATTVAELLGGRAFLEAEATLEQLQRVGATAPVIHLATHGDFNPQNPLFSSLALADGSLTTLDIFNLRLQASLVTLSACQTGRSLVKGGDELMGLMRAFLYAGAASLVLSQWRVADEATHQFMEIFYQNLAQGLPKGRALQATQSAFIDHAQPQYRHPYYWAAFFLVGDTGAVGEAG